jgi:hypothetical protein
MFASFGLGAPLMLESLPTRLRPPVITCFSKLESGNFNGLIPDLFLPRARHARAAVRRSPVNSRLWRRGQPAAG